MAASHTGNGRQIELGPLAAAREAVYTYLSVAFCKPPSLRLTQSLTSELFLAGAEHLFSAKVARALRECAASIGDGTVWENRARQEFMDLFKVPGAQSVLAYEAAFRDSHEIAGKRITGLLQGPSTVAVKQWYRLAAAEISDDYKDLPDHIGLELNYLAHLCKKEREFIESGDQTRLTRAREMQRDFLAGHVVGWIGQLRDKILEKTRHPFFQGIAELAVEFTHRDLDALETLLGPSRGNPEPE